MNRKEILFISIKEGLASIVPVGIILCVIDIFIWCIYPAVEKLPIILVMILTLISCYYRWVKKVKI